MNLRSVEALTHQDGEVRALTSLRFLAALLVLLFHFPPAWAAPWSAVAGQGHVGVTIFFVLSGFLITARYAERFARGEVRLGEYFAKRAARILPLYYALLALSLAVVPGAAVVESRRVAEWTLTQGLFGESIHALALPTSWSLTVEECFYALAPIVLLSVAGMRRRARPAIATVAVLAGWTAVLYGAGLLVVRLTPTEGQFLASNGEMTIHTLFGRFFDFAVGALAAFAWPAARRAWGRAHAGLWATAGGIAAIAAIVACEMGMAGQGGIEAERWAPMWAWNLLLAPAAGALILSLTCAASPLARLLSLAPLPYLGRVSYALYLVQMSPLGKGVLYPLLPRHGGMALVALYAGLIAISAVCYEVVEEPARRFVLGLLGHEPARPVRRAPGSTRLAAVALLAGVMGGEVGSWGVAALEQSVGAVSAADARAAAEPGSHVTLAAAPLPRGRGALLIAFPRAWREGWRDDVRAPSELMVFADGVRVPFARREPEGAAAAAFFRGPRAELLAVRTVAEPAEVSVVRPDPAFMLRLHAARLVRAPRELVALLVLMLTASGVAFAAMMRTDRPARLLLAHAGASLVLWSAFDADLVAWAPLALAVQGAVLAWRPRGVLPSAAAEDAGAA